MDFVTVPFDQQPPQIQEGVNYLVDQYLKPLSGLGRHFEDSYNILELIKGQKYPSDQIALEESNKELHEDLWDMINHPFKYGWLAGGTIRDYFAGQSFIADIDLFFRNEEEMTVAYQLAEETWDQETVVENDNVIKTKGVLGKIYFVKVFNENPIKCIDAFDFTVCCAAIDIHGTLYHHKTFFIDLAKRKLVVHKLPYPLSSLNRLRKYSKKGYGWCKGTSLAIAKGIQGMKPEEIEQATAMYID